MHTFQRSLAAAVTAAALLTWWGAPARAEVTYYNPPHFKVQIKPSYPESARAKKETGTVFVKVLVGADGKPRSFTVRSSGHKDLDAAVLAAAKASSYAPASRNGQAVAAFYDFSYQFTLSGLAENAGSSSDLAKKLEADPKNVPTRIALTEFYINKSDYASAESTAQEGTRISPSDARIWAQLGRVYYQDATAKSPTDVNKLKQASDAYDKAIELDQHGTYANQAAAAYASYAFNLMAGQQYAACSPYASKATTLSPKEMQYRMLKGDCEVGSGNAQAALTDYEAAQGLDDKKNTDLTARLLADIGNAKFTLGDEAGGLEALNESERIAPHSPFAYQYMATHYIQKGNLNAALNPLTQLVQVDPKNKQALVNIGDIYVRQKNFTAAQQAYSKALALDSNYGDALFGQAELAAAQGNTVQADSALARAVAASPSNTSTYNAALANLLLEQTTDKVDHSADAAKYAQAATTADPNNANAWYSLGIALADQKKKDQANAALHKAFDLFKAKNDMQGMNAVNQAYMQLNGKDQSLMTGSGQNERVNQPGGTGY